jgi:hypothetical protein
MPSPPPAEEADLNLVRSYLRELGADAIKLPETQARMPDFKVMKTGEIVAFCEVKSPNDPWLDDLVGSGHIGGIVGGARSDPVFNRLSRHVSTAARQFRAVNSDRAKFNVLAFVNHDSASHFGDLLETLTGHFHADDGERIPTMPHMVERLGRDREEVDAYLWFCAETGQLKGYFVTLRQDDPRLPLLCELLQIDRAAIQRP